METKTKTAVLLSAFCLLLALSVLGCGHKSSLLLERQARGQLIEEQGVATPILWTLDPLTQSKTLNGVDVAVSHATWKYLHELFANQQIFGAYAGLNPYFLEQIVFYVKIANHSGKRLRVNPDRFILLDDLGNQYQVLGGDYSTALAESKAPIATITRGVIEEARPGYFGVGVPVGRILGKPQQRYAVLRMASLQSGDLYDGVVCDGLVAFWNPHQQAKRLKLVVNGIKTNFDAADIPEASLEFVFEFSASQQQDN